MLDTQGLRPAAEEMEQASERIEELEAENSQLKEAVQAHAVVDQAIGVVLAVGELTPDEGWAVLRGVSQNTNIKLRHVAELVLEWARTGQLCTDIRCELERQLGLTQQKQDTDAFS